MKIEPAQTGDYPALIALWETSVRATHHFLQEEDIATLKPLILEHYFDAVRLYCARQDGVIVAPLLRSPKTSRLITTPGSAASTRIKPASMPVRRNVSSSQRSSSRADS